MQNKLLNVASPIVGTEQWLAGVINQAAARPFAKTSAANVEPLPRDSEYIPASALVGVDLCFISHETRNVTFNGKTTPRVEYVIFIVSRPELGRRKLSLGSRRALAQAAALKLNEFPFLGTVDYDDQLAFEGAKPGIIVADSWGVEARPYFHAPFGETPPAF